MYGMPEGDCLCLKEISIRSERGRKGERERWAYNQHVLVCLWVWRHSKKAPRNFSFAEKSRMRAGLCDLSRIDKRLKNYNVKAKFILESN